MGDTEQYRETLRTATDIDEVHAAIVDAGKAGATDLEPAVRPYLDHEAADLRNAAVATLGMRWNLDGFRAELVDIWERESSDLVRSTALHSWATYFIDSRDQEVAQTLYDIANTHGESKLFRATAIMGIAFVFGLPEEELNVNRLHRTASYSDFEDHIPWEKIDELLAATDGTGDE